MKQVVVTGGRHYKNKDMVYGVLDLINPDMVIQGGATGADTLALQWAKERGKLHVTVEAQWDVQGLKAGPVRNRNMLLKYPNASVVAFLGNNGTANCIAAAYELDRIILEVHE